MYIVLYIHVISLNSNPNQLLRPVRYWTDRYLVSIVPLGFGMQRHRGVYFRQWSNGGQNLVKMCLARDLNPCDKKKCFNGKRALRYNTDA